MFKFLIIACVAAFLINRLIAIIGKTGGAQFVSNGLGKINILKDVTNTADKAPVVDHKLIAAGHKEAVLSGIAEIMEKVENFSLSSFVKSAREAMETVSKAVETGNEVALKELIDSGFIQTCKSLVGQLKATTQDGYATSEVSEAYMFSNKAFITMLIKSPESKWTFSRHTKQSDPKWYLSSIAID
jgi:predicted lipid-binding transport protein (Tim44 family)